MAWPNFIFSIFVFPNTFKTQIKIASSTCPVLNSACFRKRFHFGLAARWKVSGVAHPVSAVSGFDEWVRVAFDSLMDLELICENQIAGLAHVLFAKFTVKMEVMRVDRLPLFPGTRTAVTHNTSARVWISALVPHLVTTRALWLAWMRLEIKFFQNLSVVNLLLFLIFQFNYSGLQCRKAVMLTSLILFGSDPQVTF